MKSKKKLKEFFKRIYRKISPVFAFKPRGGWVPALLILIPVLGVLGILLATNLQGIAKVVAEIIAGISQILISLLSWAIGMLVRVIIGVAQYNNFLNEPAVRKGWEILRDLANMFFVLGFLVIAFATVLMIERYSYKRFLLPLLMMALLVNFSLTICGLVIDFAQVIMLSFVNAFKDVGEGNLINLLALNQLMKFAGGGKFEGVGTLGIAVTYVLAAVFAFVAVVVFAIIAIILILRIVALWFLCVLSPLAFIFYVIPGGKPYADLWQRKFVNQVIIGPVFAFFIWFTFYGVQVGLQEATMEKYLGEEELANQEAGLIPYIGSPRFYAIFILGCGMLIGALTAAKQLGVVGASLAAKGTDWLQRTGTKAAKWVGRRMEAVKEGALKTVHPLTSAVATGLKTPLTLITKGAKGVKEEWGKWAKAAAVSPIPTFVKGIVARFGKEKGGKDLTVTQGFNLLKTYYTDKYEKTEDQKYSKVVEEIDEILSSIKETGGATEDQKNRLKEIIGESELQQDEKDKLKNIVDKDIKTIKGLDDEEVKKRLDEIKEVLERILTIKGLSESEVEEQIKFFDSSTIKTEIEDILKKGGADEKKIDNLINRFLGTLSARKLAPLGPELPRGLSFTDKEKETVESVLLKNLPVFTPLSEEEFIQKQAGLRGLSSHIINEVLDAHKKDLNLGEIKEVLEDKIFKTILDPHFKAGQISLSDRRKVKEEIEKQIDQLINKKILTDQEGGMLKTKLLAQVELIPAKPMTRGEMWKQILKDAGKWAGEKLTLPLTYTAATLEALPDIPIFDIDAILKDVQNFNARRTRKREASRLGKLHDLMNLWVSWGKDETDWKSNEMMRRVLEEKQEIQNKTLGETDAVLHELYTALKGNDMPRANAALIILAENNDLNEMFKGNWVERFTPYLKKFLAQDYLGKKLEIHNEKTGKLEEIEITPSYIKEIIRTAKAKGEVNPVFMREMIKHISLMATKEESTAAKIANMIGMITLEHGAPHMAYGMSRFNPITGRLEFTPFRIYIDEEGRLDITLSQETIDTIVGKMKNFSQRMLYQRAHPGIFATEDMFSNMRGINPLNIAILVNAEPTFFERPYEMRADVITKLTASSEFQRDFENLLAKMMAEPYKFISPYLPTIKDVLRQIEVMRQYMEKIKRARLGLR